MSDKNKTTVESENIVDSDVSNVYQAQHKPTPSHALDSRILALAKQKSEAQAATKSTGFKWRKWQWPASIAASVMFISVIVFTQYEQFDPRFNQAPQSQVDTYGIADQATLDDEQLARKSKLERRVLNAPSVTARVAAEPLLDISEFSDEGMDEPERAKYAEKEALTLAAKAMDNVEIEPLTFDLELTPSINVEQQIPTEIALSEEQALRQEKIALSKKMALNEELAYENAQFIARQKDQQSALKESQRLELKTLSQASSTSSISEDNDRAKSKMLINNEYLDSLLKQLEALQTAKAVNDIGEEANQQTMQTAIVLQKDIFDYLLLLKTADPTIQIEQKYLQVLSKQQITELAN